MDCQYVWEQCLVPRGWGAPPHSTLPPSGLRAGPQPPGTIWAGKHKGIEAVLVEQEAVRFEPGSSRRFETEKRADISGWEKTI